MTGEAIYDPVRTHTKEAFGHPINLHLFRDCAATMIAERDPAHVRVSRDLLGHSDLRSTEAVYNHARVHRAAHAYHQHLAALRGELNDTGRQT